MASRGAAEISEVRAGRASDGGRKIATVPPGMETLRNSALMAAPEGMCCTQGASWPRMRNAPPIRRAAAATIRLPDV